VYEKRFIIKFEEPLKIRFGAYVFNANSFSFKLSGSAKDLFKKYGSFYDIKTRIKDLLPAVIDDLSLKVNRDRVGELNQDSVYGYPREYLMEGLKKFFLNSKVSVESIEGEITLFDPEKDACRNAKHTDQ
jgi:hypothetical protein